METYDRRRKQASPKDTYSFQLATFHASYLEQIADILVAKYGYKGVDTTARPSSSADFGAEMRTFTPAGERLTLSMSSRDKPGLIKVYAYPDQVRPYTMIASTPSLNAIRANELVEEATS